MSNIEAAGSHLVSSLHTYSSSSAGKFADQAARQTTSTTRTAWAGIAPTTSRQFQGLAQLQSINDNQNTAAIQVRTEDQRMDHMDQLLMQMKQYLFRIIKNYPPYPPGEPERVKFLRSFNGLRQQIESLTVPPDSKWLGRMPGQPSSDQASTIPSVPSPAPAATGFPIPALPDMADDNAVQATLNSIDSVHQAVVQQQQTLSQSAGGESTAAKEAALSNQASDGIVLMQINEPAAKQKSVEIRQELSRTPAEPLPGSQSMLLQAAG